MIDKAEQYYFQGVDLHVVLDALHGVLYQHGIAMHQADAASWSGKSNQFSWGMAPKVSLSATPSQSGFSIHARITAEFDTSALVVMIVLWLVFFPVAIVLFVFAYQDFQNRSTNLMRQLWAPVAQHMAQLPAYGFTPPLGR